MDTELHEVCISARRFLHQSFNDLPVDRAYLFRMDTKSEAGRRIREARDKLGLKLRDVEEAIPEISVSRLSNWEQGINMIGVDEAKKLAPVLHVSPGYILTVEDETPDERAKLVLKYWNALDERGRDTVLRVAESESAYLVHDCPNDPGETQTQERRTA